MSVRSDVGVCRYCGDVRLLASMLRIRDGEYEYTCQDCAVQTKGAR